MISIALVDDHKLLRDGLGDLIGQLGFMVILKADNGKEFIEKLPASGAPDVVLLDTNMPVMSGLETVLWIRSNYPEIKIMVICMHDDEQAVREMIENGAHGYIFKDCDPSELKRGIKTLIKKGYYYYSIPPLYYYLQPR
jgi:two-component system invasion response regulator UvrY